MAVGHSDVLMPFFRLYLNGVQLDAWVYRFITKVKFEELKEDGSAADLIIYFDDPELTVMNENLFRENETVVRLVIGFATDFMDLFEGMVYVREDDYQQSGRISWTVTCKDVTATMKRNDINKAYKGQTYSDVVKYIAGKYGLKPDVDDTMYIYDPSLKNGDVIQQSGKSDLDFVRYLAEEIGFVFYVDSSEKKLVFKRPDNWTKSETVDLEYKQGAMNLLSFRPKYNEYDKNRVVKSSNVDTSVKDNISGDKGGGS